MLFDNVAIKRDAVRLEVTITACEATGFVSFAAPMLFATMMLAGGLFVLFFDPRLDAAGIIAVVGWLCAVATFFVAIVLGIVWRSSGSERWTIDADSVRYERWFGQTRVKQRCVPSAAIDSITVEERHMSSRSGHRIYRKPVLKVGRRPLRSWGNLHAHDAAEVRTALQLAAHDFGFGRMGRV